MDKHTEKEYEMHALQRADNDHLLKSATHYKLLQVVRELVIFPTRCIPNAVIDLSCTTSISYKFFNYKYVH